MGEDSRVRLRIYKDFIKEVFEKNMRLIFEKTEELQLRDIVMEDLKTKMTNLRMSIQPAAKSQKNVELELLFDEELMIMEMHDLEFVGAGRI